MYMHKYHTTRTMFAKGEAFLADMVASPARLNIYNGDSLRSLHPSDRRDEATVHYRR